MAVPGSLPGGVALATPATPLAPPRSPAMPARRRLAALALIVVCAGCGVQTGTTTLTPAPLKPTPATKP